MGHKVLWMIRDCVSGEIVLAQSLLSATTEDLAGMLGEVKANLPEMVQAAEVISDGRQPICEAVADVFAGVFLSYVISITCEKRRCRRA